MDSQAPQAGSKCFFVCPITGFRFCYNRRFLFAAILMIVWTNVFACIWHGSLMSAAYQATANLWRGPTEMNPALLNGGLSIMAFFATYIFAVGYQGTGWKEGLRFGIVITMMFLGLGLVTHATQPIPSNIIGMWALGDLITYCIGGILLSLLLKK